MFEGLKHGDRFLFHRQFFKSKMRKEKFFLLLRQYEEEMLDAFLQDDDYFPELTSLTFVKGPGDRYLFHGITKSVIINS